MKKPLLVVGVLLGLKLPAFAQCCSPGAPSGGTVNQGTLAKKNWRTLVFYQYATANQYYTGSTRTSGGAVERATSNFVGASVAYGITPRLTAEATGGYYLNRTEVYRFVPAPDNVLSGCGLSEVVVQGKYSWLKNADQQLEFTTGLGVQLPTTRRAQELNGVVLAQEVQPSSNAFGYTASLFLYKGFSERKLHFFLASQFSLVEQNASRYQSGNALNTSFFTSYTVKYPWSLTLQVRSELRSRDYRNDQRIEASGSSRLFVSPQVNLTLLERWDASLLLDVPVYQHYNGTQLGKQYNVSLILNRVFKPKSAE